MGDLFHQALTLVPGTAGTKEETFFKEWVAGHAQGYFRARNGGVHRGGIMGENWVDLPLCNDADLEELGQSNLLLYGNERSNAALKKLSGDLPIEFEGDCIRLADNVYRGEKVGALAVFPHPLNAGRYAAVHGGTAADAICWGSHIDMQLVPDFLVYDGGAVLDWGFWGNDWRSQS